MNPVMLAVMGGLTFFLGLLASPWWWLMTGLLAVLFVLRVSAFIFR